MEKKTLYASREGRSWFSGRFAAPLPDGSDGPLPSGELSNVLNTVIEDGMRGRLYEYEVKLQGGTYYLDEPIRLIPKNSARITFMPYDGEEVIFSGGQKIEGFTETTVNGQRALVADVPLAKAGGWDFHELYVNKQPRRRPMYPQNGELRVESVPGHPLIDKQFDPTAVFQAAEGDLAGLSHLDSAEVVVVHYWIEERMPIVKYDPETRWVYCDRFSRFQLRDDMCDRYARYRLENVFEAFCEPGQWYLDKSAGKLYYLPLEGETAENILVEAPKQKELLVVEGEPARGEYVEGITFQNIIFENTMSHNPGTLPKRSAHMFADETQKFANAGQASYNIAGALRLFGAKYCGFAGCTMRNLGNYAIEIGEGCSHNFVDSCDIYHCGAGGVRIGGGDAYMPEHTRTGHNCVNNCRIYECTQIYYSAIGIYIADSYSNYIGHNDIHDLKYSGISCGWVWGFSKSVTRDNIIEYNHIYRLGDGQMSDMGGIYLLGPQGGTEVRGNHIHDIVKANYGGWGIYLDEGSSYIVVEKNIVHHTASETLHIHYGKENNIRYNILAFGGLGAIGVDRRYSYTQASLQKNILVTDRQAIFLGGYAYNFEPGQLVSEGNFIFDVGGDPFVRYGAQVPGTGKIAPISVWQQTGCDQFAQVGDPGFSEIGRLELRTDSVAYRYGFPQDVTAKRAGARR